MKCSTGRLKERGGGERHAPAKPRLVAVLRSKLRFTRFLQVPTGSHCLSPPPLSFGLLDYLLSLSLYFPQVLTGSHCLSPFPLPFRLLDCLLSLSLYFPQVPTGSLYLSPTPLSFRLLDCHTLLNSFST